MTDSSNTPRVSRFFSLVLICTIVSGLAFACKTPGNFSSDGSVELFNGKDLTGWKVTEVGSEGPVEVEDGAILLDFGTEMTGITYTNKTETMNYELTWEARILAGTDFFCGFTFPISTNSVTLVMGGWGGFVTGISSFDHLDASENETTCQINYEKGKWYPVKVRVEPEMVQVWIEDELKITQDLGEVKVGMRSGEIEFCAPLGIATWATRGAVRNIRMRPLE